MCDMEAEVKKIAIFFNNMQYVSFLSSFDLDARVTRKFCNTYFRVHQDYVISTWLMYIGL